MNKERVCYFFLIILTKPCYLQASSVCEEWIAKVTSVQGKVDVKYLNQSEWETAHQDEILCYGDGVRTAKNSRLVLKFSNHAVATLDQNSTLIFPEPPKKARSWLLNLLEGSVFFRSRKDHQLDIHTPFLNAVHKGTEFMVTVSTDKTQVTVFDGEVAASNQAGHVLIKQGVMGEAQRHQTPRLHSLIATPENAVQWTLYYPPVADYQLLKLSAVKPSLQTALSIYQRGDLYTALEALENVPKPERDSDYLNFSASLLLTVGRVDEARQYINQVVDIEPNNSTAFALQAIIAVAQNRQDTAISLANKAIVLDPKSDAAHIALSYAYQLQFKVKEALEAAREATQLAPSNALVWARLSELQLSIGDRDAALESAKKAQTLNAHLSRIHTIKGFAELAENNIDTGKADFEQAIALDSSDPTARLGLGVTKIRQGQLEEGKNDLEVAVNLDPNNAILRSYLGKSFYELRNKEFASKEFDIAKLMDSKDPTPWFYDAILKQTTNRPVDALQDMQKAIELNDNRGVYRSNLLLDKDRAARQVGLGRIYNSLGFDDVANRLALKSLVTDPSNYSAHRLLSDSYATKPRYEIARASEHLQSQLLQPLNYNPIQPSLAYSDLNIIRGIGPNETSFNEYNRLFERNGLRFTTTGIFGSNSTLGDETAISGIHNKFSYSLGQLHYQTDGFRENNDLKHNVYNAFAQYEISPTVSVQTEYRHRETEHGDLQLKGEAQANNSFDKKYRRKLEQDSYRYGMKISPAQHSDVLFSFIHANREEDLNNDSHINVKSKSYDVESQYLFHNNNLSVVTGAGMYRTENDTYENARLTPSKKTFSGYDTTQYFSYLYSSYKFPNDLNLTVGLSFDHYRDNEVNYEAKISELNPKFGLLWKANDHLSFRAAAFKSVKSAIIGNQTLQPTQLAGFNQFFDDLNGTVAWQYGVGLDSHFYKTIYAGIEAYKRDLKLPPSFGFSPKPREELYRLYFNWTASDNWAVNSEFRFENYRSDERFPVFPFPRFVETAYLPTEIRFFHPVGFFASLKGTYVNQKVQSTVGSSDSLNSSFYLVDASVGYRFPKQFGLISLEAKNLLDTNFKYRDRQFQMNEQRSPDFLPERMLFGHITLNF